MFTATHRTSIVHEAGTLEEVLAFVLDCVEPSLPEDAVIWRDGIVVAVVLATGDVVRFDLASHPRAA